MKKVLKSRTIPMYEILHYFSEPRVPGNMISSKRPALHGDEKKYKRLKTMIAYSREKQSSLMPPTLYATISMNTGMLTLVLNRAKMYLIIYEGTLLSFIFA